MEQKEEKTKTIQIFKIGINGHRAKELIESAATIQEVLALDKGLSKIEIPKDISDKLLETLGIIIGPLVSADKKMPSVSWSIKPIDAGCAAAALLALKKYASCRPTIALEPLNKLWLFWRDEIQAAQKRKDAPGGNILLFYEGFARTVRELDLPFASVQPELKSMVGRPEIIKTKGIGIERYSAWCQLDGICYATATEIGATILEMFAGKKINRKPPPIENFAVLQGYRNSKAQQNARRKQENMPPAQQMG